MRSLRQTGIRAGLLSMLLLQSSLISAAIWQDLPTSARSAATVPVYYRALRADHDALKQALASAPLEFTSSQGADLDLPMPDGSMQRFRLENSPIMAPQLAARYPEIQTYRARGVDDPTATGRLDMTPQGFHGMLTTTAGTVFIDPDGAGGYRSYYKRDYVQAKQAQGEVPGHQCGVDEMALDSAARPLPEVASRTSGSLRSYRLAVAATGEYTQFHGGVAGAVSAIATTINRVNEIYERDLAISLNLIANNDAIVFPDPGSDPYQTISLTYTMADLMADNQTVIDNAIGSSNYDAGHLFTTTGGGLARVGVVCLGGFKAQGVTGHPNPVGDAFDIDLVAHELGHQLGANHTFNGTDGACAGGRVPSTAVEPGSGSTVMAYAGICVDENLQLFSDATFHAKSLQEILAFTASTGTCFTNTATGNLAPSVNAGIDRTIPRCTPFELQPASVSDDGTTLLFQWDQMDTGAATDATTLGTDLASNPLFRSFLPTASRELRIFPRLSALLNGTADKGDTLPAFARTLDFLLTVRDGAGGVNEDALRVVVDGSLGPFEVNGGVLNGGGSFLPSSQQTIEWAVGGTEVLCPKVSISLLALNSAGTAYCGAEDVPDLNLGSDFDNIGSALVTLPNLGVSRGRIKVACADNVFFSLSQANIVVNGTTAAATNCRSTEAFSTDTSSSRRDLVAACKDQIGTVPPDDGGGTTGGGGVTLDTDGGGGVPLYLPLLLGVIALGRVLARRA